ncbi:PRC-barrel domain-containing protein [Candidatus Saccharibacteria bacterium]|nr:PRC-barrel domain-containing protein [Candidatus Saccharibacteria bacterium]MBP5656461.1 PRC-barrel domain-containing protein [Candidatus Saccharibacteria bacterium]
MLLVGSKMIDFPVLSLHVGGEIARTKRAIIDPEDLKIIAYTVDGPVVHNDPEVGNILDLTDVREMSDQGLIVNSADVFTTQEDVVKLDEIMSLEFDLVGLKVVDQKGKKLGKIIDYTIDSGSFTVYQLIVQRPVMSSFLDPQLTINRSQIVEIDDFKVVIKHSTSQVKVKKQDKAREDDFVPNFVNPFRKPDYAPDESSSSKTSK